ncbi:HAUS augmin-like complex subunit 1 [Rhynochetos jubatus]
MYGHLPIPVCEVDERTTDILYEFMQWNEASDRDAALLIEDMKQRKAEYERETNYLQCLLRETLGISPHTLTSEGTSNLQLLADSAMALETDNTSLVGFFCSMNDLTSEMATTAAENKVLEMELIKIGENLSEALVLEEQLKKDLENTEAVLEAQEVKANNRSWTFKFLQKKIDDLRIRLVADEEELAGLGLDELLTHESLTNLSQELAELQDKIKYLTEKLQTYDDLAPSPFLLEMRIQDAEKELSILESQLTEASDMTLDMFQHKRCQVS